MLLRVPELLSSILWEGPLESATEDALEQLSREWTAMGIRADTKEVVRDLPVLSIGQPEVWPLAQAYPRDRMPPLLQVKIAEADFYLVRLACSLRPVRDRVQVKWFRFMACLLPDDASNQPIALDLHPLQVTQRVRHDVKVTINPTLRFQ